MDAINLEQAKETGKRYTERVNRPPQRGGVSFGTMGASPDVDRRKERLQQRASEDYAQKLAFEAEASGVRRDPRETLNELAAERIIGSNDLMGLHYLELAVALSRAVCRIRIGSGAGTGVLIGPGILMTNHHVIASKADAGAAEAQFDYQENRSGELLPVQTFRLEPQTFFLTNKGLDFTLVGTAPHSAKGVSIASYPWIRLIRELGKAEVGDPVNIIQHPRGGLKQIALRNNNIIDIPAGKPDFLYYTTDTEPGSSGSPCFNNQWEIVALHHQAVPRMDGDAILRKDGEPWREDVDDPARIDWIANEGTRTSALVAAVEAAVVQEHEESHREQVLSSKPPNPVELARRSDGAPSLSQSATSFHVPLTITVSVGEVSPGAAVHATAEPTVRTAMPTEKVTIDPDWSARTGYDEHFLGVHIPLPTLSPGMQDVSVEVPKPFRRTGEPHVLDYHHYSVAMHKERCFAWYSAAVIDGDRRFELPDRNDKWFIDPRIDDPDAPEIQCGEELYATKKSDRGHLTRYLDVAWGDTFEEALSAAHDTLHFTNACLQIQGFNRSQNRWQGIERHLLENKAKKELRRIVVVTGPIFDDADPVYGNEFMNYTIPIPTRLWKLCAIVRPDGSLSGTAFVLAQEDVHQVPGFQEALDVAAVQITVKDLEQRTGLTFEVFRDHDHLADGGAAGTLEVFGQDGTKLPVNPLQSLDDIVV